MSEFLLKILPVVLSFCIFVTTVHGRESCNCRCVLPHYEELGVCDWLKDGSPKVDNNRHEINILKDEIRELSRFKNYFERKMTDDVWTFIETFTAQSTTEKTSENSNTNTKEPLDHLVAEIEMLKKKFKDEQDRLEAKIEQRDKNSLRTDNLLEIVTSVVTRVFQEANEQKSETEIANDELLGKFNYLEKETSKVKDDFQTRSTEIEKQISSAKNEVFARMNETFSSRDLELKTEFFKKVNENEETSSRQRRELKDHVEQVDNLLRNEMSTQQKRWIDFEEKADEMEEILKEINPKEITSNISRIWYNVSEIKNDATVLWHYITGMQNGANEMWNNICRICTGIQPIRKQENCENYLPPMDTIPNSGLELNGETVGVFEVVQDIWFPSKTGTGIFSCLSVIINSSWFVISAGCIKNSTNVRPPYFYDYKNSFRFLGKYQLKPYLYSENQVCSGCIRNDIGLLKTKYYTNESSCLPTFKMRDKVFGSAVFFGRDPDTDRGVLLKVHIIPDDECQKSYPLFESSMLCTEYDDHALRMCNERGNGILFKDIENRTLLIGIVENCGSDGQPILYSELAYFSNWIYSFIHSLEN